MASGNGNETGVFDEVMGIVPFQNSDNITVEATSSNNDGHVVVEKGPGQVTTQASGTLYHRLYRLRARDWQRTKYSLVS